jgi:hypothetical protein
LEAGSSQKVAGRITARPALLFRCGNLVRNIPAVPRRESARAASDVVVVVVVVVVLVFGGVRRRGVFLVDRSCLLIRLRRI